MPVHELPATNVSWTPAEHADANTVVSRSGFSRGSFILRTPVFQPDRTTLVEQREDTLTMRPAVQRRIFKNRAGFPFLTVLPDTWKRCPAAVFSCEELADYRVPLDMAINIGRTGTIY